MRLGMIAPYPLPVWGWIFYFAISFLNLILYRERGADLGLGHPILRQKNVHPALRLRASSSSGSSVRPR